MSVYRLSHYTPVTLKKAKKDQKSTQPTFTQSSQGLHYHVRRSQEKPNCSYLRNLSTSIDFVSKSRQQHQAGFNRNKVPAIAVIIIVELCNTLSKRMPICVHMYGQVSICMGTGFSAQATNQPQIRHLQTPSVNTILKYNSLLHVIDDK